MPATGPDPGPAALVGRSFWLAAAVAMTGIAHMFVVKKDLFRALKVPIDGGLSLGGERIFGDNKTWRGVVFMIAGSAVLGALQGAALGGWAERSGAAGMDFRAAGGLAGAEGPSGTAALALGYAAVSAVLGLGYALGELPNSFLKRRVGVHPGKTGGGWKGAIFLVVDQADSVVAALGLAALVFPVGLRTFVVGTVCLTLLHLGLNGALYLARVRKNF